MRRRRSLLAFALALAGCAGAAPSDPGAIDLSPREDAPWSIARLLAPRSIEIDTAPPGASLDLFYLRDNRQERLEHSEAPARVRLPARIAVQSGDAVLIRAQLDGYEAREVQIGARNRVDRVALDLVPAANQLEGVALRYLGGRGALELRTRGKLVFRAQPSERGFRIALLETAPARPVEELLAGSARPLVDALEFAQIGGDLYLTAALSERGRAAAGALRFHESLDRVRGSHVLAIELAPETPAAGELVSADAVLARAASRAARGCALAYDRVLRTALEPEPSAAPPTAPDAPGQLARLRAEVAEIEAPRDRRAALQSLVAPDLPEASFAVAVDRAEAAERTCLRSDRRHPTPPR